MVLTPSPGIPEEFERGVSLVDEGKYDEAIAVFNVVLREDSTHAEAFLHRGRCWDRKSEHDRAIEDFSAVIRLSPNDGRAFHFRGVSHAKKKEYAEAMADYERSLELVPTDARCLNNRGALFLLQGDADRA